MRTISANEFRARCLAVVNEVNSTREPILITKRGKPVARLIPAGKPAKFIGRLKGKFKIVGDILSPIVPPEDWTYDLDNLSGKRRT
jgi:prevent-host-death family protein